MSAFAFSALGLSACGPSASSNSTRVNLRPAQASSAKALAKSDIAALATLDTSTIASYDQNNDHRFSKMFGGTTNKHIQDFFNTRIKHVVSQADLDTADAYPPVSSARYTQWLKKVPTGFTQDTSGFEGMTDASDIFAAKNPNDVKIIAANIGTEVWLRGLLEKQPYTLAFQNGLTIRFDQPTDGLMLISPNYSESQVVDNGKPLKSPVEARQAVLLHEARHSDCTGGISESDLDIARNARDSRDFDSKWTRSKCGHLHAYCPEGHDYSNFQACDRHPWGAYTVSAVFAGAFMSAKESRADRAFLEMVELDSLSRLLFDRDEMFAGKMGPPDLTSKGLLHDEAKGK